jgi:Putative glucoamylase
VLARYAADTWRSFGLLLDPATEPPSDNVSAAGERSRYIFPTNVGAYLWGTLAARDSGVISVAEARRRIAATQCTIAGNYRGDVPDVLYTCRHYGSLNTEPRIASYLGIAFGQVPATHYFYFKMALPYARRAALDNLDRLRRDFDVYGEGGFFDAVNVDSGQVSRYWLALDQGMVMAALGNELTAGG